MTEIYGKVTDTKKDEWQSKLAFHVIGEWDKGQSYVTNLNDLYEDIYAMLRGERPEKNYDWQSNLTLRKAFQVTWTAISYITQKIWGAQPVIGVKGFNDKGCWQREKLLEVWMDKNKYFLTMVLGLLRLLLNGTVIIKKEWKQRLLTKEQEYDFGMPVWDSEGKMTIKAGKTTIAASFPLEDRPVDTILNNRDVIVDWMLKPGQPITEGRFIIHRETVDIGSLYNSGIDYINLDDIKRSTIQQTSQYQDQRDTQEKTQRGSKDTPPESDIYAETEVFERQGIFPVKTQKNGEIIPLFDKEEIYKEDTEWRHMVVTVADKTNPVLIRWEPNTYNEMTYMSGQLYLDPERWEAMGLVEPAKDVFIAQDDNMNASFDEIWKNLMPPAMFNKFAVQDWDSIKWAPGQKWMMQGNPNDSVMITRGTEITRDAWQKHGLLEDEGRLITSVMPGTQGLDKSKTATQGVINTQFSTGKLDFLINMIEITWLIPSSEMSLRFAQQFAHNLTFIAILGEAFKFDQFLNEYRYQPVASSVKLPEQKEIEISQNLQLMQTIAAIPNPGTPKILNYLLADILRNRNKPQLAEMFDEDFFEPSTDAGNLQMMDRMLGPGTPSNEQGIGMSPQERGLRGRASPERGLLR